MLRDGVVNEVRPSPGGGAGAPVGGPVVAGPGGVEPFRTTEVGGAEVVVLVRGATDVEVTSAEVVVVVVVDVVVEVDGAAVTSSSSPPQAPAVARSATRATGARARDHRSGTVRDRSLRRTIDCRRNYDHDAVDASVPGAATMDIVTRRQLLGAGLGAVGALGAVGVLNEALALLWREDLVPGEAKESELLPSAWTSSADRLTFAAIGDNGSGGRHAMAVAGRMAQTYELVPFELVALLGDICYYGSIRERFDDVFIRPMSPLIDAGVEFELAVGNHDGGVHHSDESLGEIEAQLEYLGTPARYYSSTRGPAELFYLDSSSPGLFGDDSSTQLEWLDDSLASSTSQWKVVLLHHPVHSSGRHGSTPNADVVLEPILARRKVDLVLAGHDHHYERTVPMQGVTHIVSGGGCKTTRVSPRPFTAAAASALHFLHLDITGDRLVGRAIRPGGDLLDRFELRAREGR
jgi:hypothetical protein